MKPTIQCNSNIILRKLKAKLIILNDKSKQKKEFTVLIIINLLEQVRKARLNRDKNNRLTIKGRRYFRKLNFYKKLIQREHNNKSSNEELDNQLLEYEDVD